MARHQLTLPEIKEMEHYYITQPVTLAETAAKFGQHPRQLQNLSRDYEWKRKRYAYHEKRTETRLQKQLDRLAELDAKAIEELCDLETVTYTAGKSGKFDSSTQAISSYVNVIRLAREILAGREERIVPKLTVKLPDGTEITAAPASPDALHQAEPNGADETADGSES